MTDSSPVEDTTTNITEDADIAKNMAKGEGNMPPNDDDTSKKTEDKVDYRPNSWVNDINTTNGGPDEEPFEEVADNIHDGKNTSIRGVQKYQSV